MDDLNEMAKKHSAGAIITHSTPFDHLQSHKNSADLSKDFLDKWAAPYYMQIGSVHPQWADSIIKVSADITKEICLQLLGDFNWRTRLVGAYFSAVKNYSDNIEIIGTHLVKSETCCVGHIYALTLVFFNTEKSNKYIYNYLDYYLTKPKLYFDQEYVFSAALFLDKINGTSNADKYLDNWKSLSKEWKRDNKELSTDYFDKQIKILQDLHKYCD